MNYILKLNPSSGLLAESLVNQTKFSNNYICGHCLRRHGVIQNNVQELSTYVSALKLILKRKENLKKAEASPSKSVKTKWLNKKNNSYITELLKVTSNRSLSTKMKIQQIKPSEIPAFAEQPGMTFSKFKLAKAKCSKQNMVASTSSQENLRKVQLAEKQMPKAKLSVAKTQKKLSSPKLFQKKEINKISADLLIESRLSLLDLGVKLDSITAKQSKTKSKGFKKANKISSLNAVKVLPVNGAQIIPAPVKQNTSRNPLEPQKIFRPKNNENLILQTETESMLEAFNLLNQKPPVRVDELVEKHVSYLKERTLLPFSLDYSRNHSIAQFLHSYVDICITNNNLNEALTGFHSCRCSPSWKSLVKENRNAVSIYNTLLKAFSDRGSWKVVKMITKWMEVDKVKLNSESFAHMLCCLANNGKEDFKTEESEKTELLKIIQNLCKNCLLNDIFAKTRLSTEDTEKILALFRKVLPSFEIEPTTVKLNSDCQLLKNLHAGQNMLQAPLGEDFPKETMEKFVEEQLMLEKNFFIEINAVYKGNSTEKQKKEVEDLKEMWRQQLHNGFVQKLKLTKETEGLKKFNLSTYLESLPVETFVNIMMELVRELVEYSGGYSPSTQIFFRTLGEKVFQCYQVRKKSLCGDLEKIEKLYKKYTHWYLNPHGPARNTRQNWQMLSEDSNGRCQVDTKMIRWSGDILNKIGKYLYEIIIDEVKFSHTKSGKSARLIPAFYSVLRSNGERCVEEVKCHPAISNLFRQIGFHKLSFPADKVPMVCPPKPWKASEHGGYLLLPTDFVRPSQHVSGKFINFNQVPVQQLYATFDSLNALQAIPWVINQAVLDVVLEIFESGGSNKLNVPSLPDLTPIPLTVTPEMSPSERFQEYKKKKGIMMSRKNEYGLWCEALYKLSLANHFRKRVFWLPQNCDFRGRVYPVPPHLNHLGADLFRSLLVFAKGKPLGPKGLDWLKIHAVNLTGTHKKRSVQERLDHANDILPEILDSAEKPLTGNKWWMESEEPWQTLAACMEIKNALSAPKTEQYVSRFPIHQDGSCNGLQHYAALGRDVIGAKSVNLTPCERPQDVYSAVAEIVEQKRAEDARNGVFIAQALEGFIERKVVKQTVMTTVYGVTKYGAKLQIKKRLEEIDSFSQENVNKASVYLSEKTFQSLNQMFCSAKEIQDWFIQCAHEICRKNDYVQWISPLGLPVIQSYGKKSRAKDRQHVIVPDSMKQKNAFPPNFVHSLDSSHMMLTALFCEQLGITFAAIHDCFWTHPADVGTLNRICREQFISLHSQEILQDLSKFFKKCYIKDKDSPEEEQVAKIFDSVPKTGDFSLDQVLNSVYFFS